MSAAKQKPEAKYVQRDGRRQKRPVIALAAA